MFGFNSWKDFGKTITGIQYKSLAMLDLMLSIQLAFFSLFDFVNQWIWSPPYSLVVYFIVLGADFLSGVAVGMKVKNEGFMTQKGQRLFIIFPAHLVILGVLFNLGRINSDIGFKGVDEAIFNGAARAFYFYVIGINLISFMKNLVMLGYIKGAVATFFENYIDKHKNITDENQPQ